MSLEGVEVEGRWREREREREGGRGERINKYMCYVKVESAEIAGDIS